MTGDQERRGVGNDQVSVRSGQPTPADGSSCRCRKTSLARYTATHYKILFLYLLYCSLNYCFIVIFICLRESTATIIPLNSLERCLGIIFSCHSTSCHVSLYIHSPWYRGSESNLAHSTVFATRGNVGPAVRPISTHSARAHSDMFQYRHSLVCLCAGTWTSTTCVVTNRGDVT